MRKKSIRNYQHRDSNMSCGTHWSKKCRLEMFSDIKKIMQKLKNYK